jgi:hypothetical protein
MSSEAAWRITSKQPTPGWILTESHLLQHLQRGSAQEARGRQRKRLKSWKDFTLWLQGIVIDSCKSHGVRKLTAQGGVSVVRSATSNSSKQMYLPWSGKKLDWTLLDALPPEIRREGMRESKTITSREQVVAARQGKEELTRLQAKHTGTTRHETENTSNGMSR